MGPSPPSWRSSADDVTSPEVSGAIAELRAQAAANPQFKQPITTDISPDRTVEEVDIPLAGDGSDSQSNAALAELRDNLIPATIGQVPGATADVGGLYRRLEGLQRHAEVARAAGLRLRPHGGVPAAAGDLPLDRDPDQGDRAQPALGRSGLRGARLDLPGGPPGVAARASTRTARSSSWMPLFLFVVLFGLSMDYHVFILTRIREAFDRGGRPRRRFRTGSRPRPAS